MLHKKICSHERINAFVEVKRELSEGDYEDSMMKIKMVPLYPRDISSPSPPVESERGNGHLESTERTNNELSTLASDQENDVDAHSEDDGKEGISE